MSAAQEKVVLLAGNAKQMEICNRVHCYIVYSYCWEANTIYRIIQASVTQNRPVHAHINLGQMANFPIAPLFGTNKNTKQFVYFRSNDTFLWLTLCSEALSYRPAHLFQIVAFLFAEIFSLSQ